MAQESVEAAVGPLNVRFNGRDLTRFMTLVLTILAIAWLTYTHNEQQTEAHKQLLQAAEEQTFFLSLSPEEREQYRLKMPASLRTKLAQSQ